MRRILAILIITSLLVVAVILVKGTGSDESDTAFSSFESIRIYEGSGRGGEGKPSFVNGEVLVKFRKGASEREITGLRRSQGCEEAYVSPFSGVRRWRVPPSKSVAEWVDFLDRHPLVEYAELNYIAYSSMVPDDPIYSYQWHFDNPVYGGINIEAAWDKETGDSDVVVAVVDSGVAYQDNEAPSYWHIDTYQAYSGSSWWCGVSTAPSSWTDLFGSSNPKPPGYGNGWKEYLQHGFDLTEAMGTVTFSYVYRYHLQNGEDYVYVEISSDGGYSWVQLRSYTGPVSAPQVKWRSDSVDLSGYAGDNVMVRFRVYSDEEYSDEDGGFNSDGAFFVDEILLEDDSGTIFVDDVESGNKGWVATSYERAPDLVGTSFWVNSGEVAGNSLDDDWNGLVDDVDGWDFVNGDAHPNDDDGHGTHVAGTIAQTTNNGFGVAGVAPGVTVMPVKVLNAAGIGSHQWIADGICYAVDNGADIISMSLGGPGSETLENATAYAYDHGVTVFAASGNDGAGSVSYPAAYDDYVIAVGATQYDESRAPYSNYGSSLDIVAPGGNTGVDQNGDGYADGVLQNTFGETPVDWGYWFYQGTSMATPHASGVAGLLLSVDPTLSPDEIRSVLESTAEDLGAAGRDDYFGYGLIDAAAALESLTEPVHLLLSVSPLQQGYAGGQTLTLAVNVFNEFNLAFNSTLTLTVTGPDGYYSYDFSQISVGADVVEEYSFGWVVPDVAGSYVAEVSLVPPQLTAYDVVWLEVENSTSYFELTEFAESSERWLDVANQTYSSSFQESYDYSQATVSVQYGVVGENLSGVVNAQNLKPNFAYQLKLVGTPGAECNERIGLAGRWWEQEWTGSDWSVGSNLNNKGDGSSPNPNDVTYFARRYILDGTSDTGYHYKYTGYLLFVYFITDSDGDALVYFESGSCYHVLWKTDQRTRVADDGPVVVATFDPDGSEPAYDVDYPSKTIGIFGEWERLPMGEVDLEPGDYDCQMVLTEDSFHGTAPLSGNWATVMTTDVSFTIIA